MGAVKGLILCGGTGTRLRPITYYFQKTMVPVGLKQKPVLEYVIRLLTFHGIDELILMVNYKAEQITNYFEDGRRFNAKISYLHDDPSLKGTAGSVINAYRAGLVDLDDTLIVYYGDVLTTINVADLLRYHQNHGSLATIALAKGFVVRVGVADLDDDDKVLDFVEKPKLKRAVSIGVIIFKGETIKEMEMLYKHDEGLDLMKDVIPYLINRGKVVYGFLTDAFWYDVLSVEAYEKLDPQLVDQEFSEILG